MELKQFINFIVNCTFGRAELIYARDPPGKKKMQIAHKLETSTETLYLSLCFSWETSRDMHLNVRFEYTVNKMQHSIGNMYRLSRLRQK